MASPPSRSPDVGASRRWSRPVSAPPQRCYFRPTRRLIDIEDVWRDGCRAAGRVLKDAGARDPATDPCPFPLDDLLAPDVDVDAAAGRIAVA